MEISRKRIEIHAIKYYDWQEECDKALVFESFGDALAADELLHAKMDNLRDPDVQRLVLDKQWAGCYEIEYHIESLTMAISANELRPSNDYPYVYELNMGPVEIPEWVVEYQENTKRPEKFPPDLIVVFVSKYPHKFCLDYPNMHYALQYRSMQTAVHGLALFDDYASALAAYNALEANMRQSGEPSVSGSALDQAMFDYNASLSQPFAEIDYREVDCDENGPFFFSQMYPDYGIIRIVGDAFDVY